MDFLINWAYSDTRIRESLVAMEKPTFVQWLNRLTLQAPEVNKRVTIKLGCISGLVH